MATVNKIQPSKGVKTRSINFPIFEHVVRLNLETPKVPRILHNIHKIFLPQNPTQKLNFMQIVTIKLPKILTGLIVGHGRVEGDRGENSLGIDENVEWNGEGGGVAFTEAENPFVVEFVILDGVEEAFAG